MESSKQSTHSSLVVVNDEILSTQVRLMELYVKQAQAMAANETARVQERFQAELAALHEELKQKKIALETQQALSHQADQNLRAEVQELRSRLLATQCSLQVRQTELDFAKSEARVLQQRIAQSESTVQKAYASIEIEVARAREAWQEELSALEGQIERKESALQLLHASVKEVEGKLRAEIQVLRSQLAAEAELLKNRTDELQKAHQETALLRRHMQQFALTGAQTEAAANEAIRIRETLQAELVALRTTLEQRDSSLKQNQAATKELEERLKARLEDLQRELAEKQGLVETRSREIGELTAKTSDLQEQITCLELANKQTVKEAKAAARAIEESLHVRVQELEAAVAEKAQGLQDRTLELESAQSESAGLRQRIEQLEQTQAQTETAKDDAKRAREGLQNELNNLHRALEQKDAWLAQREVEFNGSSQRHQTQLSDLQNQLAEARAAQENQKRELGSAKAEMTALNDRLRELESAKAAAEATASAGMDDLQGQYQLQLGSLQEELQQNQLALEERQTTICTLEEKLDSETHRLEAQLSEKQTLLDRGHLQLQEKVSEISVLREEVARSEFARRQTEMLAAAQAEQIRGQVKAEVGALDAQLKEKQNALEAADQRSRELESVLNTRIADLQTKLAERQSAMDSRESELSDLRSRNSTLLSQINDLQRTLEKDLEHEKFAASRLEQGLRLQVTELQTQLAEKLAMLGGRNDEVQALESKITVLLENLSRAEAGLRQSETTAHHQLEQIRREFERELAVQQREIRQKAEALQEREEAWRSAEQNLQFAINGLRAEVSEKHALLENRNDELVRVKSDLDAFQERIAYLESTARPAEVEVRPEAEQEGEQTRIELDQLWDQLSQKEGVLEDRQTAVNDLERNFQAQIDSLQSELAEKQALLENQSKGFLLGEPTLSESQKEKLGRLEQLVEAIKADNEQTLTSSQNRRWRFGLGRKRRWKT